MHFLIALDRNTVHSNGEGEDDLSLRDIGALFFILKRLEAVFEKDVVVALSKGPVVRPLDAGDAIRQGLLQLEAPAVCRYNDAVDLTQK